jgi:hypothetical protein
VGVDINRNGNTTDLLSLGIFDGTADASLTLYSSVCDSAASFTPSKTILLISSPGWRIDATAKLSLNASSRVDIDPDFADARRLRSLAARLTKKEHVNPAFPAVGVSHYESAGVRALWCLSEIDAFARANPAETLLGYVSVVLTQLNIVTPAKRNMLLSSECCGIALFGNEVCLKCKGCGRDVEMRINPRIVRPFPSLDTCELKLTTWMDSSVPSSTKQGRLVVGNWCCRTRRGSSYSGATRRSSWVRASMCLGTWSSGCCCCA